MDALKPGSTLSIQLIELHENACSMPIVVFAARSHNNRLLKIPYDTSNYMFSLTEHTRYSISMHTEGNQRKHAHATPRPHPAARSRPGLRKPSHVSQQSGAKPTPLEHLWRPPAPSSSLSDDRRAEGVAVRRAGGVLRGFDVGGGERCSPGFRP